MAAFREGLELGQLLGAFVVVFPEIGLLGIDVLRDIDSGKLYVVEVNSLGYVWLVNSKKGRALQSQFNLDIDGDWGVTQKAASILVDAVRARAA